MLSPLTRSFSSANPSRTQLPDLLLLCKKGKLRHGTAASQRGCNPQPSPKAKDTAPPAIFPCFLAVQSRATRFVPSPSHPQVLLARGIPRGFLASGSPGVGGHRRGQRELCCLWCTRQPVALKGSQEPLITYSNSVHHFFALRNMCAGSKSGGGHGPASTSRRSRLPPAPRQHPGLPACPPAWILPLLPVLSIPRCWQWGAGAAQVSPMQGRERGSDPAPVPKGRRWAWKWLAHFGWKNSFSVLEKGWEFGAKLCECTAPSPKHDHFSLVLPVFPFPIFLSLLSVLFFFILPRLKEGERWEAEGSGVVFTFLATH